MRKLLIILLTICSVAIILSGCGIINPSGLGFTLSDDKTYYIVTGIDDRTNEEVVIPSKYKFPSIDL